MYRLQNDQIGQLLIEALPVLQSLHAAGHEAYIVGGAVRDTLLYKSISDIDIATSAKPAEVVSVFEKTIPTGLQHGTVTVLYNGYSYEITTFRTETVYQDHRRPEAVQFVQSLLEDLNRRDFTMNAMALNDQFHCIDPFHGITDLEAGVLRCVGHGATRFQEDALRMLRAIRFLTTYKLAPTYSLWRALIRNRELMKYIAMERVTTELGKIMNSPFVDRGITLLCRSHLLLTTKLKLHFSHELYRSSMKEWLALSQFKDQEVRWALLFYQCGLSNEHALEDMQHLKFSKKQQDKVSQLLALHRQLVGADSISTELWLTLLERHGMTYCELWLEEIAPLLELDRHIKTIHNSLHIYAVNKLDVKGSDLIKWRDASGGPWVQHMLSALFRLVAIGKIANKKEELKTYIKNQKGGEYNDS